MTPAKLPQYLHDAPTVRGRDGELSQTGVRSIATARPSRRSTGRWIDRYHLLHCIAAGGMGEVHLALRRSDGEFRRWVAVKIVHPDVAGARRYAEMFRAEARLVARIDDPHVCAVHDYGVVGGTPYLAMEYLHGVPLAQLAQQASTRGAVPPHVAARIVADAARGLAAAHAHVDDDGAPQPVVHRDVSPHNLLVLYTGQTKVVDFGIARPVDDSREFTRTGEVRGKVAFMPPEQLRGDTPHPAMDLWALGVLLWEVTLGRRLFAMPSDAETMTRVLRDPVPPPSAVRPGYPAALEAVVMRALERDLARRYGSAMEMARDLEAFVLSQGRGGHDAVAECLAEYFTPAKNEREALLRELARDVADSPIDLVVRRRGASLDVEASGGREAVDGPTASVLVSEAARGAQRRATAFAAVGFAALLGAWGVARLVAPPSVERASVGSTVRVPVPTAPVVAAAPVVVAAPAAPAARAARTGRAREPRAVAAPARSAAPPEATAGGRLSLRSSTPGTVFEGGRRVGHTPLVGVPMGVGRHSLRLVPDDAADEAQELDVEIESGAESTVALRR